MSTLVVTALRVVCLAYLTATPPQGVPIRGEGQVMTDFNNIDDEKVLGKQHVIRGGNVRGAGQAEDDTVEIIDDAIAKEKAAIIGNATESNKDDIKAVEDCEACILHGEDKKYDEVQKWCYLKGETDDAVGNCQQYWKPCAGIVGKLTGQFVGKLTGQPKDWSKVIRWSARLPVDKKPDSSYEIVCPATVAATEAKDRSTTEGFPCSGKSNGVWEWSLNAWKMTNDITNSCLTSKNCIWFGVDQSAVAKDKPLRDALVEFKKKEKNDTSTHCGETSSTRSRFRSVDECNTAFTQGFCLAKGSYNVHDGKKVAHGVAPGWDGKDHGPEMGDYCDNTVNCDSELNCRCVPQYPEKKCNANENEKAGWWRTVEMGYFLRTKQKAPPQCENFIGGYILDDEDSKKIKGAQGGSDTWKKIFTDFQTKYEVRNEKQEKNETKL